MHFRKEWHRRGGAENQRDPHRETTRPASKDRDAVEDSTRARHSRRPRESMPSSLGLARTTLPHPKGATQPSRHPEKRELTLRCSDRHLVVRGSTEGTGVYPALQRSQPVQRQPHRLRSAWGVRDSSWGSPDRNPQITSDSPDAAAPRVPGRTRIAAEAEGLRKFDIAESITQLRDGHVPTKRTWTIHESPLSVLNAQTREAAIVTVLRRQKPTTPRNARVIRHL